MLRKTQDNAGILPDFRQKIAVQKKTEYLVSHRETEYSVFYLFTENGK